MHPRRSRDLRLLQLGRSVSTAGSALTLVALPLAVLDRGGVGALGTVLASAAVAQALGYLPGGALVDRVGPRAVMIAADLTQLLASAGLVLALLVPGTPVAVIAGIAAVGGLGAGAFQPAGLAIMPRLVPPQRLAKANASYLSILLAIGIVVPALGGLGLMMIPAVALLGVDAGSFLVSVLALLAMARVPAQPVPRGDRVGTVAALRAVPALVPLLLSGLCGGLLLPAVTELFVPVLARTELGLGGPALGTMLAAVAAGSLCGTVCAGVLGRPGFSGLRARPGVLATLALLTNGPWICALAVVPSLAPAPGLAIAALCLFGAGAGMGTGNVLLLSLMQRIVPGVVLGRVMSVMMLCNFGAAPISLALGALVLSAYGVVAGVLGAGIGITACVGFVLAFRSVRELRSMPDAAAQPRATG